MTGFRKLGLSLAALTLVLAQSGAAKPSAPKVKQTAKPVAALAMDGPRVAYASGGKIYIWNVDNGATSVVKGVYSKYGAEVAIAGRRIAWVTRYVIGNTYQTSEFLYTAPAGGKARLLRAARRYAGSEIGEWYGGWIAGAVGSGGTLAVSTWWSHGRVCTGQRLSLVTPTGLKQIATGPGAIMAASADGSRIAVLRNPDEWPYAGGAPTPAVTVGIYSSFGTLLREIVPSAAREVALTGDRLVVLTETKTLEVYAWKTGTLLHTWPIAKTTPRLHAGHLAAYGQLATYSVDPRQASSRSVHVISLATGKDVVIGTGRSGSLGYYGRDAAMSARGLVYVVTYHEHGRLGTPQHGRLVFVPTAKLLAAVAPPRPQTLVATSGIKAFAQDADSVAWVESGHAVHVKQLSTAKQAVVGWLANSVSGRGAVPPPQLGLVSLRALWPQYGGGLTRETVLKTGALGQKRATTLATFAYNLGSGDGTYLAGVSGYRGMLVFGRTDQKCREDPCTHVAVTGGVVTRVLGRTSTSRLGSVPPPALLAGSDGRVAVAPAADQTVLNVSLPHPPVPAANGPVDVYDTAGHQLVAVHPAGTVAGVALAWPTLAALVRRADGTTAVERYDARTGALLASATVGSSVTSVSVGARGVVWADGSEIYLLGAADGPRLLWRSTGKPFGVSIEGTRVAWAVSGGVHGYVQALTLPVGG